MSRGGGTTSRAVRSAPAGTRARTSWRCGASPRRARRGETTRRPSGRWPRARRGRARPGARSGRPSADPAHLGLRQARRARRARHVLARRPVAPPDADVLDRGAVESEHGDAADPLGSSSAARTRSTGRAAPSPASASNRAIGAASKTRTRFWRSSRTTTSCGTGTPPAHGRRARASRDSPRRAARRRRRSSGTRRWRRPRLARAPARWPRVGASPREPTSGAEAGERREDPRDERAPRRSRSAREEQEHQRTPFPRASWSSSAAPPRSATAMTTSAATATRSSTPIRVPSREGSET